MRLLAPSALVLFAKREPAMSVSLAMPKAAPPWYQGEDWSSVQELEVKERFGDAGTQWYGEG
jgi:hypothetical protein